MSRSKNSRRGSKYVRGCPGCSQCDANWVERNEPLREADDFDSYREFKRDQEIDEAFECYHSGPCKACIEAGETK